MIQKWTLSNGVRVVAESIPHVRSVAMGLWIGTGFRHETLENNGISHFLEHMMFKGTKTRTARQLAEGFDEIGGQVNAFTSKEMTCYYAKVMDEHLELAVELLADMVLQSTFDPDEIRKEQKVVEEEIRMVDDTPDDVVHDWLFSAAVEGDPLGFPILGSVENVRSFDRSRILDFKEKRYHPQQLVIACAGNLPQHFLELLEAKFGHFKGEPDPISRRSQCLQRVLPSKRKRRSSPIFVSVCLGSRLAILAIMPVSCSTTWWGEI